MRGAKIKLLARKCFTILPSPSSPARKRSVGVLSALALSFAASQVPAQADALEEVIVTASKRSESLQDVPMTVSAFSAQVIEQAGIDNADDLAILTPSLTISTNNQPFTAAFRIRGIGTSQTDIALEPSVGLFVDDVFLARSGLGMSDLTDIERIEVLNGPQGTLYGKNTNAGAISIFTRRPNLEEFEGFAEVDLGDYDLAKVTLAASSPLTSTLAYRISGTLHERDGYFKNSVGDDPNNADDWNMIGKLLWVPSDHLSVLLNASRVDRGGNCCAADAVQGDSVNTELAARGLATDNNDPFDHEIAINVENEFRNETDSVSLVIDYERDWGSFKSITAWSDSEGGASYDVDRSQLDVMSYVGATSEGDTLSQELRFTADAGGSVNYQLGLFYYQSTTKGGEGQPFVFLGEDFVTQGSLQPGFADLLPPGVPGVSFIARPGDSLRAAVELDTETFALFGQSTWNITDAWRLTGGLRWTDEEKDADLFTEINSTAPSVAFGGLSFLTTVSTPIDDSFSRSSDDVNWLVNTAFDIGEDTMLFASVATGSKSGGFNTVNGLPEEREFDDESTISYELGMKSTLLDARLRINASLFYSEIEDFQFQQQLETGIGTRVSNQAEVETSGLDIDVQALPLPNLTLTAGILYMHTYEITAGLQKGDDLPFTAEYSGNASATLVFPLADGGLYLRADYSYMDDHLTTASANPGERDVQDREILNAKLGWRNAQWNASVWGKNLTDDEYAGLTAAVFPVTTMQAYFLAPPRTWGVTVRYDF